MQGLPGDKGQPGSQGEAGPMVRSRSLEHPREIKPSELAVTERQKQLLYSKCQRRKTDDVPEASNPRLHVQTNHFEHELRCGRPGDDMIAVNC